MGLSALLDLRAKLRSNVVSFRPLMAVAMFVDVFIGFSLRRRGLVIPGWATVEMRGVGNFEFYFRGDSPACRAVDMVSLFGLCEGHKDSFCLVPSRALKRVYRHSLSPFAFVEAP